MNTRGKPFVIIGSLSIGLLLTASSLFVSHHESRVYSVGPAEQLNQRGFPVVMYQTSETPVNSLSGEIDCVESDATGNYCVGTVIKRWGILANLVIYTALGFVVIRFYNARYPAEPIQKIKKTKRK